LPIAERSVPLSSATVNEISAKLEAASREPGVPVLRHNQALLAVTASGGPVSLTLHSRCVGDVTVVTCNGRIVAGEESKSLQVYLDQILPEHPHVLLHLGGVEFIDSGGLGLIARYLTRPQDRRGTLRVCAVSPKIDDVLRITRLKSVFQPYATEADSIADMHRAAEGVESSFNDPDVLCVDDSPDVLTYLREVLKKAGYRTLTASNLPDALILLKATRPKTVVIGAELRAATGSHVADEFHRITATRPTVELPAGFSGQDAGDAAQLVLQALRVGGTS
jgi:anti-sigma B factor antagonist